MEHQSPCVLPLYDGRILKMYVRAPARRSFLKNNNRRICRRPKQRSRYRKRKGRRCEPFSLSGSFTLTERGAMHGSHDRYPVSAISIYALRVGNGWILSIYKQDIVTLIHTLREGVCCRGCISNTSNTAHGSQHIYGKMAWITAEKFYFPIDLYVTS